MATNYWSERQARSRLLTTEQLALSGGADIIDLYKKSLSKINKDISDIFQKYAKESGLDVIELTQVLTGSDRKQFLLNVQRKMMELGFEIDDVYKPEYIARITRLEALKEKIYWEMLKTNVEVERKMTTIYKNVVNESYDEIMYDYVGNKYDAGSFTTVHKSALEQLLKERWSGQNYKESVWRGNTNLIARDLPYKLGEVFIAGRSYARVASDIRDDYAVSMSSAMRIVRTESAFFSGQGELQAMKDLGIKKYQYYAIMDKRTSDICRDLDGEIFLYEDAQEGENYPPMHPNCRSRAVPLMEDEEEFEREREIYIKDMEASDSVDILNSDQINATDYDNAYDFVLDKYAVQGKRDRGTWVQGKDGTFTLLLDETDTRITLSAIATQVKGTGLGSKIMEDLKEYSDASAKLLIVDDVQNPEFFKRFDWLEHKESLNVFMHSPLEEDIRKMAMKETPLIKEVAGNNREDKPVFDYTLDGKLEVVIDKSKDGSEFYRALYNSEDVGGMDFEPPYNDKDDTGLISMIMLTGEGKGKGISPALIGSAFEMHPSLKKIELEVGEAQFKFWSHIGAKLNNPESVKKFGWESKSGGGTIATLTRKDFYVYLNRVAKRK